MTQTPQDITVSLEKAKALKEAGWPQGDSCFQWCQIAGENWVLKLDGKRHPQLAAPTAEEILRRLPPMIEHEGTFMLFVFPHFAHKGRWMAMYEKSIDCAQKSAQVLWIRGKGPFHANEDTLANACASMYCYLAENNLLPPTMKTTPQEMAERWRNPEEYKKPEFCYGCNLYKDTGSWGPWCRECNIERLEKITKTLTDLASPPSSK